MFVSAESRIHTDRQSQFFRAVFEITFLIIISLFAIIDSRVGTITCSTEIYKYVFNLV